MTLITDYGKAWILSYIVVPVGATILPLRLAAEPPCVDAAGGVIMHVPSVT